VTYAIYYRIVWSFYINLCKGSTKNSFYSCKKKENSKRFVAVTAINRLVNRPPTEPKVSLNSNSNSPGYLAEGEFSLFTWLKAHLEKLPTFVRGAVNFGALAGATNFSKMLA
jgi:hypothetical protein